MPYKLTFVTVDAKGRVARNQYYIPSDYELLNLIEVGESIAEQQQAMQSGVIASCTLSMPLSFPAFTFGTPADADPNSDVEDGANMGYLSDVNRIIVGRIPAFDMSLFPPNTDRLDLSVTGPTAVKNFRDSVKDGFFTPSIGSIPIATSRDDELISLEYGKKSFKPYKK